VRYLAVQGTDAVKIWFIASDERPFEEMEAAVRAAGDEARRAGVPLIVHATGLREARVAVEAGAHLLVHGVGDREVDDEFVKAALAQGTLYCPTLTVMGGYQRLAEAISDGRVPEADDPNGCLDAWTLEKLAASAELGGDRFAPEMLEGRRRMLSEQERIGAANLARLATAGVPVVMGTDAGNPLTLHGPSVYAELEAMAAAGMLPEQVLVAATRNAARAMGREADLGTVEPGKVADFLLLTADPTESVSAFRRIEQVVRGGVARTPAELRPLD
jgi:imidazolonepropionase-like amidohydrolase